jgi:hypothetical protein
MENVGLIEDISCFNGNTPPEADDFDVFSLSKNNTTSVAL